MPTTRVAHVITRRALFAATCGLPALFAAKPSKKDERFRLRTESYDIELTLRYHDAYASKGFWFLDESANRVFCLSSNGEKNRMCSENFHGSLALANYRVKPRSKHAGQPALREYVRMIDRDQRLDPRAPFERTIQLQHGVATDLQAFGSEAAPATPLLPPAHGPWYLLRQDLFLESQAEPFLVLYWKQALPSIRILDMIPGDQTSVLER